MSTIGTVPMAGHTPERRSRHTPGGGGPQPPSGRFIDAASSLLFDDRFIDRVSTARQKVAELRAAVDGLDRLSATLQRKRAAADPYLYNRCRSEVCYSNVLYRDPFTALALGLLGGIGVTCLGVPAGIALGIGLAVPVLLPFMRERSVLDSMGQEIADQRAKKALSCRKRRRS